MPNQTAEGRGYTENNAIRNEPRFLLAVFWRQSIEASIYCLVCNMLSGRTDMPRKPLNDSLAKTAISVK